MLSTDSQTEPTLTFLSTYPRSWLWSLFQLRGAFYEEAGMVWKSFGMCYSEEFQQLERSRAKWNSHMDGSV